MLSPYFGGIVSFVKDTEIYLEREGQRENIRVDERNLLFDYLYTMIAFVLCRTYSAACERVQCRLEEVYRINKFGSNAVIYKFQKWYYHPPSKW